LCDTNSGTDCSHICSLSELEDAVRKARTEEIRIPFGVGIAGFVAQNKEIINIKDAYKVTLNTQGDQKVSVHLMIKIQKVTSNVQT
jgi:hypothetical protein